MPTFDRLLNPRGIAVVGASPDAARPGGQTIRALQQYGFGGGVYPVNPKYPEIAGYRCHGSLAEIEGECDLAVIALPAAHVPGLITQCADRGIRFAVVLGGGYREAGEEGAKIEASMLAAARKDGVRLIGPNCLGLVNLHTHAYAAFGSLTRPPQLEAGPVSVVLQSASFGMSIVVQCAAAGIGFRYVVTSGNEADISAPEIMSAYVDDPGTKVVLAYLEGVRDGRALMAVARRAVAAGKPLIILKAGNTEQGKRAAESHTAHLTGDYDIYRAAFRQCGVIEVEDVHEAIDMVRCVMNGRVPKGRRTVVMGGSGGAAAMFSDKADEVGLTLSALAPETTAALKASLPPLSILRNPDRLYGRLSAAGTRTRLRARVRKCARRSERRPDGCHVRCRRPRPTAVWRGSAGQSGLGVRETSHRVLCHDAGARTRGPRTVTRSRHTGTHFAQARGRRDGKACRIRGSDSTQPALGGRGPPAAGKTPLTLPAGAVTLSEHESKQVIAAAGVPVTRDRLLPLAPGAGACADLAFPLALKIVSPDIAHNYSQLMTVAYGGSVKQAGLDGHVIRAKRLEEIAVKVVKK